MTTTIIKADPGWYRLWVECLDDERSSGSKEHEGFEFQNGVLFRKDPIIAWAITPRKDIFDRRWRDCASGYHPYPICAEAEPNDDYTYNPYATKMAVLAPDGTVRDFGSGNVGAQTLEQWTKAQAEYWAIDLKRWNDRDAKLQAAKAAKAAA